MVNMKKFNIIRGILLVFLLFGGGVFSLSAQHRSDTLTVYFRLGSAELDMNYRQNGERFQRFIRNVEKIQDSYANEYIVDVDFYASASPEGPFNINEKLATKRMEALSAMIHEALVKDDSAVDISHISEDWENLYKLVKADNNVPHRDEVLMVILEGGNNVQDKSDEREWKLRRLRGGKPYRYIYRHIMPDLRAVNVLIHTKIDRTAIPPVKSVSPLQTSALKSSSHKPLSTSRPAEVKPWFIHQLTLKTNTLGWGIAMANIAVEYDFAPHFSVALPFYYSGGFDYFIPTIKFRGCVIQPEVRWYPWLQDNVNGGFYVGAHLGLGWYNYALDGNYRIQDQDGDCPSWGGGLAVGYTLQFKSNPRWGMEFALGAGVYDSKYDLFYNEINGPYYKRGLHKTWFGIDNAAVSFTYKFDMKKKGGNK